jgi:hypothetical protein
MSVASTEMYSIESTDTSYNIDAYHAAKAKRGQEPATRSHATPTTLQYAFLFGLVNDPSTVPEQARSTWDCVGQPSIEQATIGGTAFWCAE